MTAFLASLCDALPLGLVHSLAALVYIVVGMLSLLIAYDFHLSKDGMLRKILIFVFTSWAVHYIVLGYMFATQVERPYTIFAGALLTIVDFSALISLYLYIKWKQ